MVNSIVEGKTEPNSTNLENFKFTLHDWYTSNCARLHCSEAQRNLARLIIAKSDKVCELTTEAVKSNRDNTNHQLQQRIEHIEFCKDELERYRNVLPLEIDTLKVYRERLTNSLTSLRKNALDICLKCLLTREHRLGVDLAIDKVETELRKECEIIKCADKLMSNTLDQTQEQIRRLKATLYFIDHDIEDKENSLRIDRHNLTLKETSLHLSIYQGKSALESSGISIDEWKMQTRKNIDSLKQDVEIAKKIRPHIDQILQQVITKLIYQKNATDEAFRRRIEETKLTKDKLEEQHSEIMQQANEMTSNITRLEKKIAEKEGFLALAHTRLGNRCQRPGLELTRDEVEESLAKEVSDLREVVISQLQQTLFEAQASLRFLLKMQMQIEEEINIKTNTLKIDEVHCMSMRQSIDYHVF
ncbi:tektin-1 [Copidosoma floridanum]|uniref:tektin-1 n=1 Tax=Copidosoma floridanum TaxID=29053 RepID=UPI0006C967C0|nr:tektin-1 [Copidosoma floridanum]